MLSLYQKQVILKLIEAKKRDEPENCNEWIAIAFELKREIHRHSAAVQRAKQRNQKKQSRRTQRGPHL